MFDKYIPELQKRFTVPEDCVIAGGAIANTLYNLIYKANAPVRDVDVYHFQGGVPVDERGILQVVAGEYDSLTINGMTLKEIIEDGEYQHIYLTTPGEIDYSKLHIVDSFDLNCVQVAFDGEELYFTPAFEKFMQTKQIEIVWIHNVKTFFRLFKKREDLDAYFWFEKVKELFSQVSWSNKEKVFNPFVSDDYIETIKQWIPEIEEMGIYIVNNRINFPLPQYKLGKLISVRQMINLINFMFENKKGTRARIEYVIKNYPNSGSLIRTAPDLFDHNFSNRQWEIIEKVYGEHPIIYFHFADHWGFEGEPNYEVTIADHIFHCTQIYNLAQKYDDFVYGIVENRGMTWDTKNEDYHELEVQVNNTLIEKQEKLVKPLPLPEVENFKITELISGLDLMKEGNELHHCVGGYSFALKNNSRFFSIKNGTGRSTLQLNHHLRSGKSVFQVSQHYGFANASVDEKFQTVARKVVDYLNNLELSIEPSPAFLPF